VSMPVLRYFGWVGSFLPALHFVANWPFLSRLPARHYPTCPRATRLAFGSIRIINGLPLFHAEASSEAASQAETCSASTGSVDLAGLYPAVAPTGLTMATAIHLPAR
jgi:hypothetical protein